MVNIILQFLLFALPAGLAVLPLSSLWPCACLCFWLLRYRSVKLPFYRLAKSALLADEVYSIKPHPRAKPEWVRRATALVCRQPHLGAELDVSGLA